jgi:hypothetical protein
LTSVFARPCSSLVYIRLNSVIGKSWWWSCLLSQFGAYFRLRVVYLLLQNHARLFLPRPAPHSLALTAMHDCTQSFAPIATVNALPVFAARTQPRSRFKSCRRSSNDLTKLRGPTPDAPNLMPSSTPSRGPCPHHRAFQTPEICLSAARRVVRSPNEGMHAMALAASVWRAIACAVLPARALDRNAVPR